MLAKLFDKGEEAGHNEFFIYDTFHCEIVKTKSGSLPSPVCGFGRKISKGHGKVEAGGGQGERKGTCLKTPPPPHALEAELSLT